MNNENQLVIYVISDSVGTTGSNIAKAVLAQFPNVVCPIRNFPFITEENKLLDILEQAKSKKAIVLHTFADDNKVDTVTNYCFENGIECYDLISPLMNIIENRTGQKASQIAGELHKLDEEYFHRIEALEFAVKYDDGKDPKGFLEADILLLGISRTSKTPLSIYLANENYKVANLPIIPENKLPKELWQVDPNKIVGLTNNEDLLAEIRQERMKSYGMSPKSIYSSIDRIHQEIDYAENLYKQLNCLTINVANKSIEETTAIILSTLPGL